MRSDQMQHFPPNPNRDNRFKPLVALLSIHSKAIGARGIESGSMNPDGSMCGCDVLLPKPLESFAQKTSSLGARWHFVLSSLDSIRPSGARSSNTRHDSLSLAKRKSARDANGQPERLSRQRASAARRGGGAARHKPEVVEALPEEAAAAEEEDSASGEELKLSRLRRARESAAAKRESSSGSSPSCSPLAQRAAFGSSPESTPPGADAMDMEVGQLSVHVEASPVDAAASPAPDPRPAPACLDSSRERDLGI